MITSEEFTQAKERDAKCAATWFTGPKSAMAMAIRDRRVMISEIMRMQDQIETLLRNRDALEAELKKFVAHAIGPRGAEQMGEIDGR